MDKTTIKRVKETKRAVKKARQEYNLENGTNHNMITFLHEVLNYPMDEAKKIRKNLY